MAARPRPADEEGFHNNGVAAVGHRRKILDAIALLAERQSSETAGRPRFQLARRRLTVMSIDLVGSTDLSRRLDPEVLREIMRAYQDSVATEIARFGGHIAKFLGDGLLVYFDWPKATEDEAERAVELALQPPRRPQPYRPAQREAWPHGSASPPAWSWSATSSARAQPRKKA